VRVDTRCRSRSVTEGPVSGDALGASGVLGAVGFAGSCGAGWLGEDVPHLLVRLPVQRHPPGVPGWLLRRRLGRGAAARRWAANSAS